MIQSPLHITITPHTMASSVLTLIGAPGSGKGTYGALLAKRIHNATVWSVGDILRDISKRSEHLTKILKSGALVDDELVNNAVIQCLKESKDASSGSNNNIFILDGFPRNHAQTSLLEKWPTELRVAGAIQFDVPDEICITKLLGRRKCSICDGNFNTNGVDTDGFDMPPILPKEGTCKVDCNWGEDWQKRDDDTAETIQLRMNVYHNETKPVLKYWQDKGQLLRLVPYTGVKEMDRLEALVKERFQV